MNRFEAQVKEVVEDTYQCYLEGFFKKNEKKLTKSDDNFTYNIGTCEVCHKLLLENFLSKKVQFDSFGTIRVTDDHESIYIKYEKTIFIVDPTRFLGLLILK
jgi:hypothetical protein